MEHVDSVNLENVCFLERFTSRQKASRAFSLLSTGRAGEEMPVNFRVPFSWWTSQFRSYLTEANPGGAPLERDELPRAC